MNDLSGLGKQPISDAHPCGNDIRDDPDFELIQDEIGKLSNPFANSSVDWSRVSELSAALLTSKSKDIVVACYLTAGLLQTQGLPGLRDGMQVLADLMQTWWDELHPSLQRMRARRNAMQWLIDRVKADGEERDWSALPQQEPDLVKGLRCAFDVIDAVLAEKDDGAPSMRPLLTLAESIPMLEPVVEPEPAPISAPSLSSDAPEPTRVVSLRPASGTAPLEIDSTDNADQAVSETLDRLSEIAAWMADAEPLRALGFSLRRIAAWSLFEQLPPASNGQTMLPGPVQPVQDALKGLLTRLDNESLINFTEGQLPLFPFWLDLNRIAAQALARLGGEGEAARREVCAATGALLARLPGIDELQFSSGMPFADMDTRAWLQSLMATGGTPSATSAGTDPVGQARQHARARASDNDLTGAVRDLQQAISQQTAPAMRLGLRIALCDLLFEYRPGAHLAPFARAVIAEVDRFALDSWDSVLAANGLRAAYNILARNEENRVEADALLERLTQLDAATAVMLVTE